ncbi:hypothetical protein BDV12DRAFT_100414 [Aspergillus spectabilis]
MTPSSIHSIYSTQFRSHADARGLDVLQALSIQRCSLFFLSKSDPSNTIFRGISLDRRTARSVNMTAPPPSIGNWASPRPHPFCLIFIFAVLFPISKNNNRPY